MFGAREFLTERVDKVDWVGKAEAEAKAKAKAKVSNRGLSISLLL